MYMRREGIFIYNHVFFLSINLNMQNNISCKYELGFIRPKQLFTDYNKTIAQLRLNNCKIFQIAV